MTVLYGSSVADTTLTTACKMAATSGGVETSKRSTVAASPVFQYAEITSQGTASEAAQNSIPVTPSGNGWVYAPGAGTFALGNWSATLNAADPLNGPYSVVATMEFWRYSGGIYTSIGSISSSSTSLLATRTSFTLPATSLASITFAASDLLYIDLWFQHANINSGAIDIYESTSSTAGVAGDMQVTTSAFTPTTAGYVPHKTVYTGRGIDSTLVQPVALWYIGRGLASTLVTQYITRGLASTLITPITRTALATSLAGVGTLAETFTLATSLTDTFAGVGTLAGTMAANVPLTCTIPGVGAITGTLSLSTALSTTCAGVGTLSGTLSANTSLSDTFAGVGTLTGSLSLKTSLGTTLAGVGTLVGTLSITWYVSGAVGTSGNGASWATAWKTFADIVWANINPGATIEIDGGASGITYTDRLIIGTSGTAGNPITIRASTQVGHNGTVTIWGGRTTPLPYSGQPAAAWTETAIIVNSLIHFGTASYVTVDGSRWHGWHIYGNANLGIYYDTASSNNTVRNLEINDCGIGILDTPTNTWYSDLQGAQIEGDNHTFELCDIHDCGQDSFQTGYNANHITIKKCWMHFAREHPDQVGFAFNAQRQWDTFVGQHQDAYQTYGASPITDLNFIDCLFGPGLMQGTILQAITNNVTISQSLFMPANLGTAIMGYAGFTDTGWNIDHATVGMESTLNNGALYVEGSGHTVTNSILVNGYVGLNNALVSNAGNIQHGLTNATGFPNATTYLGGTTVDPQFINDVTNLGSQPSFAQLAVADFTPQAAAAVGKGCTDFVSLNTFLVLVGAPPLTVMLAGVGTLTGTASLTTSLTRTCAGVGTLSGTLSIPGGGISLSVTMAGVGTFVGTITAQTAFTRTLAGVGTLASTLALSTALTVSTSGTSTLSGVFTIQIALFLTCAGAGTLAGTITLPVSSYLSALWMTRDGRATWTARDNR